MQTFLVASNDQSFVDRQIEKIKKQINVSPFNLHEISPSPSIGIATIRNISQILSRKPYGGGKRLVVIKEMEKATVEASNAMLKILEEPPVDTLIILTCENINKILPTIVSRCQIVFDPKGTKEIPDFIKTTALVNKILSCQEGERLMMSAEIAKSKDETLLFLNSLLPTFAKTLHQPHKEIPLSCLETASLMTKVMAAKRYVEKNVNYKATLDILFLGFPSKTYQVCAAQTWYEESRNEVSGRTE